MSDEPYHPFTNKNKLECICIDNPQKKEIWHLAPMIDDIEIGATWRLGRLGPPPVEKPPKRVTFELGPINDADSLDPMEISADIVAEFFDTKFDFPINHARSFENFRSVDLVNLTIGRAVDLPKANHSRRR